MYYANKTKLRGGSAVTVILPYRYVKTSQGVSTQKRAGNCRQPKRVSRPDKGR